MKKVIEGEVVIQFLKRAIAYHLSDYPAMESSLEVEIRNVAERIGKQLVAFTDLPMEHLKTVEDYATFNFPKTWFQHLKAEVFPKWFIKIFPVIWKENKLKVVLDVGAVYPKLPEAFPKGAGEIRYRYQKNSPELYYPYKDDLPN